MERTIYKQLLQWKNASDRKPLVMKGARQIGKTFSLKAFGKREFRKVHSINFQEDKTACELFAGTLAPAKIIEAMEFYLETTIDKKNDLIFLDEIQDCPRAITSLKYFCENMPEMAVVSAGSLLGVTRPDEPFPVGKVFFMDLNPMSFEEFLLALGEARALEKLRRVCYPNTLPSVVHQRLGELLKEYFIVGGLPEVVAIYRDHREHKADAFSRAREKQVQLLRAYMSDFSKYSGKADAGQIASVFESIPSQLARENKKFKASDVMPGARFSRLKTSIDWLEGAGLALKVKIVNSAEVPFSAFTDPGRFKLYLFDIGILGALAEVPPKSIFLGSDFFSTFRGGFCENFVAQEFVYSGCGSLYSWMSKTAKVEFLREIDGDVFPVEVKAGLSGKLKSLNAFAARYPVKYRTRISGRNLEFNDQAGLHSYPLYLSYRFPLGPENLSPRK